MRYVGTNMLDKSDSTHWKNQSTLLYDVSWDPCMGQPFSLNCPEQFYRNTLVWQ